MNQRQIDLGLMIGSLIALAGLFLLARELWVYAGVGR